MTIIRKYPTPQDLAHAAAADFLSIAQEALARNDRISIVLAGGSTPRLTYQAIARQAQLHNFVWERVHIFWGDERCVPPDHQDSNYRMARETLLDELSIPEANIHRMEGEIQPRDAAAHYQQILEDFFGKAAPRFELVFLGMGSDGHTASLFPGTRAVLEKTDWVMAHHVEKLGKWRITMTPILLNQAKNIHFLVTGKEKALALQRVLTGRYQPEVLPAQIIHPTHGNLLWYLDREASNPG